MLIDPVKHETFVLKGVDDLRVPKQPALGPAGRGGRFEVDPK
jgi:hypothetical protein